MSTKWLTFFFKLTAVDFKLKEKMIGAEKWFLAAFYALAIFLLEIFLFFVSLPLFFVVSPKQIQEKGRIFPSKEREPIHVKAFIVRRKISLITIFGAGGIFIIKASFIALVSFYLLGAQQLLAATQNWDFSVAGNYTYDGAKIEVTGGVAQLKDTGSTSSGSTTNPGFDTGSTGWTGADWGAGGGEVNPTESRITTGGNPGAYIQISVPAGSNDELGGYWYQSFVTTAANPTTTVSFDWDVTAYDSTPAPLAFKLYVFVDTGSGAPVIGQEAWSSATIIGTSGWASVSNLDVSSKVTAVGTYYLKVAMWVETPGSTSGPFTVGYDNVSLNWSKTTHVFASDSPSINPTSSLTMTKTVSWDSFTETATKNGGEIYYQLTGDNGTTWKYWTGAAWATAGASNYNTATIVNTNIGTFATSSNQINFKAFLSGDGTQQVILDNVAIGYTENTPPVVTSLAPAQNTQYGYVFVNYNLQDANSDPSNLANYEYSLTGAFTGEQVTMVASSTDPSHSGTTGLITSPTGIAHTFVWDAKSQLGAVYNTSVYVRLRGNDGIQNGAYTTSTAITVDYVNPVVSNVEASEVLGSTDVNITYDLADNTTDNLTVELQVSGDGGSTWVVPATSVTGTVGSGITAGTAKTITWHAGTDYPGHQQSNIQVRVRAKDKWQNQGDYTSSANFSLDTLPPANLVTADLKAQPNAGDTTVLIGGSFTEVNPSTNTFYAAINGGSYNATTTGDLNTATPSNQATAVGATLTGNDYISKVRITHTDKYGESTNNENTSPSTTLKYVKPYTPAAPTLSNPVTTRLDLQINPNVNEASGLEYAILETTQNKFVQADGTLGASAVWETLGTGAGQWGSGLAISGKVRVIGLSSPVSLYIFKVKSRNTSDTAHAASSESAYSATAQITNTAPSVVLNSYAQTTDGTDYVTIAYTGTDGQGDISSLPQYQYSTDNTNWFTLTQKNGVGSNGTSTLVFLPTGSDYNFMWDSAGDLPALEISSIKVRLKPNDSLVDGSLVTSGAFSVDHKAPVVSAVTASQNAGARTVAITYTLTDANTSFVDIGISSDGGSTWNVASTTATGAVGAGVAPGSGKTISWNAGVDFNNQYNTNLMVRVRARDSFGNQGVFAQSSAFTVDTHAPVVSNVTAAQDSGADTFTFHYDVSEDAGNVTIVLAISSDGGSTWVVPVTSATGDTGSVVPGTSKIITWNGVTDFNNQEKTNMQIRITATDQFTNNSNLASSNFSLDTKTPRVTSVSAVETLGDTNVSVTYTLADQNNSFIEMDISSDGGTSWDVASSSVSGDIGNGIGAGSKTITWNAKTDFPNQTLNTMKVRVRGRDTFNNQSGNTSSVNFSLDTLNPASNVTADLQAQPNAGDTTVLIGGSFTETNPDTNVFYLALNGGNYGTETTGTANTASLSNQATATGVPLKGNDSISKVKIVHTDDYGQSVSNENTSPAVAYKYVKPYTPPAPTVDNPSVGGVDVTINKNSNEIDGLEYAIFETSQNKFVQADGTLGASAVWQTLGTGAGQWGQTSGISGKININGLTTHSYLYQWKVKSRNTSDFSHAASSESALSGGASSANQSPVISFNSVGQTTNGTRYVNVNYTGSDLESENSNLAYYKYSTDNSTWHTMTEKSGVGSEGISTLAFLYTGSSHLFAWDVGTDLVNTEDSTVYVTLQANDGTSSGALTETSAFTVDTKNPVVASVTAAQVTGTNSVTVTYNLTDLSTSAVELDISSDGGTSWNVASSSVSGSVGAGVTPGTGKTITWNAGADFANQEVATMKARVRAIDAFGNVGSFVQSSNFNVDTKAPEVSSVSAVQNVGFNTVTITYNLADANNSTVYVDISEDGGSTWGVATSSLSGAIGAGITPGTGKTITWNAATDFPNREQGNMVVRIRATDVYSNASGNVSSSSFSVDTKAPVISNVSAAQLTSSNNVSLNYDLSDSGVVNVAIDISSDSGATWTVTKTSVTGDIGAGITPGSNKVIIWNAGTDFSNQDLNTMMVRVRGTDGFNNTSANVNSSVFSLDDKAPVVAVAADLKAQPNAGDSTVLVGGSFTETHPSTNIFLAAINGGAYAASTTGQAGTAAPSDQATGVGATLTGSDYVSKVKLVETDTFGNFRISENTSPNTAYKYIKPYTPGAPTVNNPQNTSVDIIVNAHAGEATDVPYAIYEISTNKYVQANGTLGASAVWQTLGVGAGQWGNTSGISGKITVTGLVSPVAQYSFKIKSRNPSDTLHAASSESDFSSTATITNTAPTISITGAGQVTNTNYVLINYTGTDSQNDTNNLNVYEYSTDNSIWHTMTQKTGVGSSGTSTLIFNSSGSNYTFGWDIATDLSNTEDPTVYVRLESTDGLASSNLVVSSAFAVDTLGPVVSNINVSQNPSSNIVNISYDLTDNSVGTIATELLISDDNGATYTVATTTLTGDIGAGISAGVGKSVTWNAGVDFSNTEQNNLKLKIRGRDIYNNLGNYVESSSFTVDTKSPVISLVSASQLAGSSNITINYTLSDLTASGNVVEFGVSGDGGSTWSIATTSFSGEIGAGQTTGAKTFIWNAGVDFSGEYVTNMKIRVRARDYFGNLGSFVNSSNFILDTKAPIVSNVSVAQTLTTENFVINYNLTENSGNSVVDLQISSDGGLTWDVASSTLTGDLGAGISAGMGKVINWNAGVDFNGQEKSNMRVRIKAKDSFINDSAFISSSDFSLDTGAPLGLSSLAKFSSTTSTVTLTWSSGVTDANFNHYELWYGSVESDVVNTTGTALRWTVTEDSNLSNILTNSTVITGVNIVDNFYVKIFAADNYNNISTTAQINVFSSTPTPTPSPTTTVTPATGGGGISPAPVKLAKPILTPLESPTNNTRATIKGIAVPRSRIDLYDNDIFVARLNSVSDNDGVFSQIFSFNPGLHSFVVKAVDFYNNTSDPSDPINLDITTVVPAAPLVFSPKNNDSVSGSEVLIIGAAVPLGVLQVSLGNNSYTTPVNSDGSWQIILPNVNQLINGFHTLIIKVTDITGRTSTATLLTLNKVETITPAVTAPLAFLTPSAVSLGAGVGPSVLVPTNLPTLPIPPVKLIEETAGATELAGLPVPNISNIQAVVSASQNNLITFAGTALPNQDVLIYIHSDQALIYRTHTDNNGLWSFSHDQNAAELTPGEHSIYAVALDSNAKVKSRPSAVAFFTVTKSLWVTIYNLLNLPTTIIAVIILSITIFWLYRLKRRGALGA